MALRTIPIHQAGHLPNLLLGGDRNFVLLAGLFSFTLLFAALTGQNIGAAVFGVVLWFSSLFALRIAGKFDPHMRDVYLRSIQYLKLYAPRSTPFRVNSPRKDNIK